MGRKGTRAVSVDRPSVAETLRAHASVVCSVPPSHSANEQVSLKKVSTAVPLVSGRISDTEETSKQKKLKQREPPWK